VLRFLAPLILVAGWDALGVAIRLLVAVRSCPPERAVAGVLAVLGEDALTQQNASTKT
jgi:hypothetical protein